MLLRDHLKEAFAPVEIPRFFDETICTDCISMAETGSWKQSNFGSRKIQTSHLNISWLEDLIRAHSPHEIFGWQYHGIHRDSCQFFKYTENDNFPDHQDKAVEVANDIQSLFTIVVYLNECKGGETGFPELNRKVFPETGKAVIFPQNLLHNSSRIEGDLKYIMRAQILYRNCGCIPY